jgi:hypothetical protein
VRSEAGEKWLYQAEVAEHRTLKIQHANYLWSDLVYGNGLDSNYHKRGGSIDIQRL